MRSLRMRLVIAAAIWIALGVAAAGVLMSAVFKDFLETQFDDQLHVNLDELERQTQFSADGTIRIERDLNDPRFRAHLSGYYWEIQRNGETLARAASLEGPALAVPPAGANAQTHTYRIEGPTGEMLVSERPRWLSGDDNPFRIIVGIDRSHLDREMQKFNYVLLWSLGAFSVSLIGAAIILLLYAMRPFGELRKELGRVRNGTATHVGGQFPDEVQPLIDDLNHLLASSGEQMIRARTQAGNMAHSLKSSLALLVDEAQKVDARGDRDTADLIFAEARRMQRQIDYQIARARAVASRAKPAQTTSLSAAVAPVIAALGRLHVERRLEIEADVPEGASVACDAEDLDVMLANLVDNACKHAKSRVIVRTEKSVPRKFVEILVEDDGPGLPPEAWDIVFNVGEQWGGSSGGSGLGLSIVRDLAQLYGGAVRLDQSELGGLKVVLELPGHYEVRPTYGDAR